MDAPYGLGLLRALGSQALVQRLRAGEDAAQSHGPVDVRRVAGGVLPRGHEARTLPPRPRHQPPHLEPRAQRHRDASSASSRIRPNRMVVVDPRETETTRGAHRHLRVRPGTDVYLLLGMAAVIVRERARRLRVRARAHPGFRRAARRLRRRRRRRDGAPLRARHGRARRDRHRDRASRVGGDLLRSRRRASAFLDPDLLPDPRPARAHRQRRTQGRQRLLRDAAAAREGLEPQARARARARLRHSGDRRARQLRHVLADARAGGDPARSSGAAARDRSSRARIRCSRTPTRRAGARRANGSTFSW